MRRKQKISLTPLTSPPPFFSPVAASSSLTDLWFGRFEEPSLIYNWNFWISMSQVQVRQDCNRTSLTCKAWPCFTMRSLQVWRFSNLAAIPLIALTCELAGQERGQKSSQQSPAPAWRSRRQTRHRPRPPRQTPSSATQCFTSSQWLPIFQGAPGLLLPWPAPRRSPTFASPPQRKPWKWPQSQILQKMAAQVRWMTQWWWRNSDPRIVIQE